MVSKLYPNFNKNVIPIKKKFFNVGDNSGGMIIFLSIIFKVDIVKNKITKKHKFSLQGY
jgi:hypothetical protein